MIHTQTFPVFTKAAVTALALLATGCASTGPVSTANGIPVPQWLNTNGTVTLLSAEHSEKIDQAAEGQTVTLGVTPWGENTQLVKQPSYFSATGKTCFISTIETSSETLPKTLCQYSQGRWGVTRANTPATPARQDSELGGLQ